MLELHECASEDQAEKRVLLIHKQYVVMKRFLAAGGYFFEDGGDRTLDKTRSASGRRWSRIGFREKSAKPYLEPSNIPICQREHIPTTRSFSSTAMNATLRFPNNW